MTEIKKKEINRLAMTTWVDAVQFIFLASSFVWAYNLGKDCGVGLDDLNEFISQWLEGI